MGQLKLLRLGSDQVENWKLKWNKLTIDVNQSKLPLRGLKIAHMKENAQMKGNVYFEKTSLKIGYSDIF